MKDYLKQPIIENKHSFKITDSVGDFFHEPGKLIFLAGIVALTVTTFFIAQKTSVVSQNEKEEIPAVVLGEATSISNADEDIQEDLYVYSAKALVQSYLEYRLEYYQLLEAGTLTDAEINQWRNVATKTKDELLALFVPARYHEAHLELVISLLNEEALLSADVSADDMVANTSQWQSLLGKHVWLGKE